MSTKPLIDREELSAILVPCYGFSDLNTFERHVLADFKPDYPFGYFSRDEQPATKRYLSRRVHALGMTSTEYMFHYLGNGKPAYHELRKDGKEMPAGAYNVALVVEGVRQCFRSMRQSAKHPGWWYGLMDGERDCYVVWDTVNRKRPDFEDAAVDKRLYVTRSGRGVVYAEFLNFDHEGSIAGTEVVVVRIEFSILDRNPNKDDLMRVIVSRTNIRHMGQMVLPERFEQPWAPLVKRAVEGYGARCSPWKDYQETHRLWLLDQMSKARADAQKFGGDSFHAQVAQMSCFHALDQVQEAWQLEVAIGEHYHSPEFYRDPNYPGSRGSMVGKMLEAYYQSSVERDNRRQELAQMLALFVIPRDRLWSYVGD